MNDYVFVVGKLRENFTVRYIFKYPGEKLSSEWANDFLELINDFSTNQEHHENFRYSGLV